MLRQEQGRVGIGSECEQRRAVTGAQGIAGHCKLVRARAGKVTGRGEPELGVEARTGDALMRRQRDQVGQCGDGIDIAGLADLNEPGRVEVVAEQERLAVVTAAEQLRAAGIPCPIVSGGSTPTALHSRDFTGITEMRPGVYVFNDLDQEYIGACAAGDIALSVLASVIGHYPHRNQLLVDAGALALSKDISAQEFQPKVGYGTIADPPAAGMAVIECSQEHGFVAADDPLPYGNLPIGARVRILPNHACITAAAYDRYYVVDSDLDGGTSVVDVYDRINGW